MRRARSHMDARWQRLWLRRCGRCGLVAVAFAAAKGSFWNGVEQIVWSGVSMGVELQMHPTPYLLHPKLDTGARYGIVALRMDFALLAHPAPGRAGCDPSNAR
jgi:hypothetical protein